MPSSTSPETRLSGLPCGLCGKASLLPAYKPEGGMRGLVVHVCAACGLVQSLPRVDRAPRALANVTNAADWGNLRYGKAFRTETAIRALRAHLPSRAGLAVLDVGANRGAFAEAFLDAWPDAEVLAIEPDERVVESYAGKAGIRLVTARIEDADIPEGGFDLIHSCHTIEHLADPLSVLEGHWHALRPGGMLYVDAPNLDVIGEDDILEEFFIDKHLYHYSAATLAATIEAAGFEIRERVTPEDTTNLVFVARKARSPREATADHGEALRATRAISDYAETRARNKSAIAAVADRLNALGPERIAIWGAGRLFRALLETGRCQPSAFAAVVDTYLASMERPADGFAIDLPETLRDTKPDYIVVMSRAFSSEIVANAREFAPNANVLVFGELLNEAVKASVPPLAATA